MRIQNQRRVSATMLLPAVITLVMIGVFPVLFAVFTSMRQYLVTQQYLGTPFVGFGNYVTVLTDGLFWNSLGRTGLFYVIAMALQVALGVGIALLLERTRWRRLSKALRVMLVLPMAMTPAVLGLVARLLLNRQFGFINYLITSVGLEPVTWLGAPVPALMSIMMLDVWQWTPFVALVVAAGLTTIPDDVYDAVRLDTDSFWNVFRHIQLPYLLPGLTAVLIIRTADILKLFDMVYVLTRGGPGVSTELISLYIQRTGFRIFDMGVASAQAILLLVLCIGVSQMFIRVTYQEEVEA